MKKPKITIVTITFNLIKAGRERTFRECVESVHNQTYKNIEHIVIDGASTDGTLDLIKEYADKNYITYISEPDSGVYDAMNKGLNLAKGDYIAFLNSDDFYHVSDGIQCMVDTLVSNKADFAYAPCRYLKEDDTFFGVLEPSIGSFFMRMPFSHQTLFVKTDLMRKLGGFDSSFRSAGDYDFIVRLCLSGAKSVQCDRIFVSYRLGGISDTQKEQSIQECIKSFRKNYTDMDQSIDFDYMFYNSVTTKKLMKKVQTLVCDCIRNEINKTISISDDDKKYNVSINQIYKKPKKNIEKFYLFGILPIYSIKKTCEI